MGTLRTVEDIKMLILTILIFTSAVAPTASQKMIISDNYLGSGTQCGPRTITGWTKNIDYYRSDTAVETTTSFTTGTGIFVAQVAGWYKICAYSRFQNSGNSVDMCIRKASTRIACYGNAIQNDWRTTGVCTIQSLAVNDQISLYLESGGSSDCVQQTSWRYNRLSIHMIMESP